MHKQTASLLLQAAHYYADHSTNPLLTASKKVNSNN